MVHADAARFDASVTKEAAYEQVLEQAQALFVDTRNWVSNLANTASLLWHAYKSLPAPSSAVNWAGFYVIAPENPNVLFLGPFHGKVACQLIAVGKGVCGAAAASRETQLVPDVDLFPGHIACDDESQSEIVVPLLSNGRVVGLIDIDCGQKNGFDETDREALEKLARLLESACDWPWNASSPGVYCIRKN